MHFEHWTAWAAGGLSAAMFVAAWFASRAERRARREAVPSRGDDIR
jgi:hypothetical protein